MSTISQVLLQAKKRKNQTAVEYVKNKQWKKVTWSEYFSDVEKIASALKNMEIKKGDRVAIFSNTRYEWAVFDMAILSCGMVTVPVYQSIQPEELLFILKDSSAKLILFESMDVYNKFKNIENELDTSIKKIGIQFSVDDIIPWESFLKEGESYRANNPTEFENQIQEINSDDLATIVYTSGTTGMPKGVCLYHEQVYSEMSEIFENVDVNENDKTLTFLPFAHVLGRIEHWAHVYKGFNMAYAESIEKIALNLTVAQPTFLIAVPRIFEKIYNSIQTQSEISPTKNKIFKWAIEIGRQMSRCKVEKKIPDLKLTLEYQMAKKLVFDKLKQKMGGRLRFAVSGGAPLSDEISRFFHAAGLLILEGYGLTETTAAVFVNTPFNYKFGTVGRPIGDVKVKIAPDGEILLKSKKIMRAYNNNPKATQEVFDDEGYFKTGDIGEVDVEGFLKITDRKKDLIKTAGGKYIAPQKLENLLKLNTHISQVLIHGDKRKYIVALITLNQDNILKFAQNNNLQFKNFADLSQNPRVKDLIRDAVAKTNSQLSSFETIKNFSILPNDFSIESGELTPSLKVKRKFCDKKYDNQIKILYGDDQEEAVLQN